MPPGNPPTRLGRVPVRLLPRPMTNIAGYAPRNDREAGRTPPTSLDPPAGTGYGQMSCTTCQREAVMAARTWFSRRMVYWAAAIVVASAPALVSAQGTTERKIDPL